jgi:hypothetical protein
LHPASDGALPLTHFCPNGSDGFDFVHKFFMSEMETQDSLALNSFYIDSCAKERGFAHFILRRSNAESPISMHPATLFCISQESLYLFDLSVMVSDFRERHFR